MLPLYLVVPAEDDISRRWTKAQEKEIEWHRNKGRDKDKIQGKEQ
jgi:hypothetical protein